MTGSIYIVGESQSGWLSVVSLIVAVFSVIFTMYWNWRAERREYLDKFWFREIFAPSCLSPVIRLRTDWVKRFSQMGACPESSMLSKALSDFAGDKEAVLRSLWLSKLFFKDYYKNACAALDHAEDAMAAAFGTWVLKGGQRSGSCPPLAEVSAAISNSCMEVVRLAAVLHGKRLSVKA